MRQTQPCGNATPCQFQRGLERVPDAGVLDGDTSQDCNDFLLTGLIRKDQLRSPLRGGVIDRQSRRDVALVVAQGLKH